MEVRIWTRKTRRRCFFAERFRALTWEELSQVMPCQLQKAVADEELTQLERK